MDSFLELEIFAIGAYQLKVYNLILAFFIFFIARTIIWILGKFIARYFKVKHLEEGRQYAIIQFIKYIIYVITIFLILQALGIQLSLLLGGAAALLVGIGLGLQQTFNDLFSGVVILMESTVEVGDILDIDGLVGKVTAIEIRTSKVETRDHIIIIIPNSKLVGDNVVNWSNNNQTSRFQVQVGVAYRSDTALVTSILKQAALEHPMILKTPEPSVQLINFGDSALEFTLHFYSSHFFRIENVKSDLRYKIVELFRLNNVEIPFPQRDLWLKNTSPI